MSKSFMDAIRGVVTEGARDKTADGMTKDAAHFRHDLHKVQDAGFKHMVQKDSETSDYAKMFSGDVDKAPDRLGDQRAPEDLNKYVEYNEHLEIEEAKKAEKHDEDCECEKCSSDEKEDVKEALVAEDGNPNKFRAQAGGLGVAKPAPLSAVQKMGQAGRSPMAGQGAAAPAKPASSGAPTMAKGTSLNRPSGNYNPMTGTGKPPVVAPPNAMTGEKKPTNFAPGAAAAAKRADMSGGGSVSTQGKQSGSGSTIPANLGRADAIKKGYEAQKKAQTDSAIQKLKSPMVGQGTSGANAGMLNRKPPAVNKSRQDYGLGAAQPGDKNNKPTEPRDAGVKIVPTSGEPPKSAPTPKTRPSAPAQKPQAAKPQAAKPQAAAPAKPQFSAAQRRDARNKLDKGAVGPEAKRLQAQSGLGVTTPKSYVQPAKAKPKAPAGTNPLKNSFEIDINGTSYLVSESHATAIAAFVEKHGMVNEMTAGEFISKEMKHPEKLTAKTRGMKVKQAYAIFKSKERRGEKP